MSSVVAVVIPNLNGLSHLPDCLQALSEQTRPADEIVVVDNGSTDGSLAYLAERWPDVRVVTLGSNTGFPSACNAGIAATTAPLVVLLNNDTAAEPGWLEHLVDAMDADPGCSWASSKLVRFDDPATMDSAGHAYSIWVGAARNLGEGEPAADWDAPRRIFGASAAAAVYRRSLFEDIGVLDDEFFLIHEDTDLDLRATMAGHRCRYVPDAVVRHKRGASYQVDAAIHLMGVRNRIWATRSLPPGALAVWVATKALRALRWVPAKLSGRATSSRTVPSAWRDVSTRAVLSASWDAMRSLPRKRRQVRASRRLSTRQFLRVLRETSASDLADARSNQ